MIIAVGPAIMAVRNLERRERRNRAHSKLESVKEEFESRANRIAAVEVGSEVDIDG